jgi:hypothetical protein
MTSGAPSRCTTIQPFFSEREAAAIICPWESGLFWDEILLQQNSSNSNTPAERRKYLFMTARF